MVQPAAQPPSQTPVFLPAAAPAASRYWLLAAVVLAFAAWLRLVDIGGPSLWMDEIWSIEISMGRGSAHALLPIGAIQQNQIELTNLADAAPWWKIWTSMIDVTHPPLYHVVLRWWMDFWGTGPVAARSLSAVFSLIALGIFLDICRLLHGSVAALLAAALMGLSIAQLDFAQEARSYPMLMFLCLAAADALLRIERRGTSWLRLALLAFALAAAELTHYFAAPAIGVLGIYAIIRLRGRDLRRTLITFAAAAVIILLAWGPWFYGQIYTLPSLQPDFLLDHSPHHLLATLRRLSLLPGQFFLGDIFMRVYPAVGIAVGAFAVVLWLAACFSRRPDALLWSLWLIGIVGSMVLVDVLRHTVFLYYLRYTILASPALYALLARFSWPRTRRLKYWPAGAVLAVLAILVVVRIGHGVPAKGNWRQFAQAVDATIPPDGLVVVCHDDPWTAPGLWYLAMRYYLPDSHRPWLLLRGPADAELLRQLQRRDSLWLISPDPPSVVQDLLPGWQSQRARPTAVGTIYPMIRIAHP